MGRVLGVLLQGVDVLQVAFIHKEPRAVDATTSADVSTSAEASRTQGRDHQPQVRPSAPGLTAKPHSS